MKRLILFCLIVWIINSALFCQSYVLSNNQKYYFIESDSLPGTNLSDFTFDRNGILWIVSTKFYPSLKPSPFSSNLPIIRFVSKIVNNKYYTIKDSLKSEIRKIVFDNFNTLYILSSKQIITLNDESKFETFFELSERGGFNSLAFDKNNNIWVGGLQTGILMFDGNAWITYNTENSSLPTNSSTNIFIDKNNIKWLTLWEKKGILKIENNQWTYFNKSDSNLLNQNFWGINVDSENNLWIGTGFSNPSVTLIKYDGKKWTENNPKNDKGDSVPGIIRNLIADCKGNICALSLNTYKQQTTSRTLSKFNGKEWQYIDIGNNIRINDIEIDSDGNIWILTPRTFYMLSD